MDKALAEAIANLKELGWIKAVDNIYYYPPLNVYKQVTVDGDSIKLVGVSPKPPHFKEWITK